MPEFRALARRLSAQGYSSRPETPRQLALRPWTGIDQTRAFVRTYGVPIRAASGVPPWLLAARYYALRLRYAMPSSSMLEFQLYRPERLTRAGQYVCSREHIPFVRFLFAHLKERGAILRIRDKRTFPGWCAEHGLPAMPVLAEWEDGALAHDTSADRGITAGGLPPIDLFSKPADLFQGFGTARWTHDGRGGWVGRDGRTRAANVLLEELADTSRTLPPMAAAGGRVCQRYLLMPCLQNHPDLAPLSNGALNTVRVVTYRFPDGPPRFLVATYKMATGDAPADNFHFGGMMAPVDLATGRLGTALRKVDGVMHSVERHPDTGTVIAGRVLPDWDAAVALALRAHAAEPHMPAFGWDVALTPDGPVLLEGNFTSGPDIMQAPTGHPLGDTPYPAALIAHVRALGGA